MPAASVIPAPLTIEVVKQVEKATIAEIKAIISITSSSGGSLRLTRTKITAIVSAICRITAKNARKIPDLGALAIKADNETRIAITASTAKIAITNVLKGYSCNAGGN